MADWDDFLTPNNFQLAWQRILRSRHYQNKDRIGLRVFEANLENNLQHLTDELLQGVYEPSRSDRIYVPKRAGTLRSQSVLTIRDRLVYQAIGNVLALRTKDTFEAITEGHVFAHLLSTPDDVFMLRRWDGRNGQYRRFLRRFREYWERGSQWIVEADIASYYETTTQYPLREPTATGVE